MDVRKKVLLDLFAAPGTLLPVVGGISALILSWALKGAAATASLGVGLFGILTGLGVFASRVILGLEKITQEAYDYVHEQKKKAQEENLDRLDDRLKKDRDNRTQESLRELRMLYGAFSEDVESGKINRATYEVIEIVDELFTNSVAQLEHSYELWQSSRHQDGPIRDRTLAEREKVVREVLATTEHLRQTIDQFRALSAKRGRKELSQLREELDEAIRVARRADERIAAWDADSASPRTEQE
ncbi:MAG: hypothetical protein JW818_22680 [Pirellulales bacterium]|nr:hypothetical protein [Pirellulales bacterium]